MFSRIYKSARALLTEPTQNPSPQTPPRKEANSPATMVTSRSQSRAARGGDEINENAIQPVVSSSSSKKRRLRSAVGDEDGEGEVATPTATPSAAKKRKTLPVREKDGSPIVKKLVPVVEIPARKVTPEVEVEDGSPAKPIEIEESGDEEQVSEEEVNEAEEEEIEKPQVLEVDTKTKHKRFGSEEAEPELFSTAREDQEAVGEVADSEEESDSEDDAPEAIGIQDAAKQVKSKERDTAKAVKDQLSASRKKRKERDEILKKQSEKGKKRKSALELEEVSSDDEQAPASAIDEPSRALTSRSSLPDFLPAEYLEDTDPQNLIRTEDSVIPRKKSKKTKFIDAALKAPKDRRVGKTTYRVAKAGSTKLAPKSSFVARSTKEAWLQGRSGGKVDPNRRAFGKAFGR
ncbi:hypothetical protein BKA65DRAFT_594551 [Rhexocercosporidium sp. MPI-PUGE-AT-0058]|nr:hypothetical protein BKA65DRAFT_594551 [Rhexocercosporidium sp. MPI-PUGE-AT-0058]